ncbi:MAG: hypothetical protein ACRCXZ_04075, partial [Patescibacteria group bacterium]
ERSAAGIDVRYDNFYLDGITTITDKIRLNPKGVSHNTGIRLRPGASFGIIKNVYSKGANHGIFIEGKNGVHNKNIEIKNFIIKEFSISGLYIRGKNHKIINGCSFSSLPDSSSYKLDINNSDRNSIFVNVHPTYNINFCPTYTDVGAKITP